MKVMSIAEYKKYKLKGDEFALYDLRVETVHHDVDKPLVCNHPVGSFLELSGENLSLPVGQSFPIYCLSAMIPILPAKQRMNQEHDWIESDAIVACPDPNCGAAFRIVRTGISVFGHHEVTVTPLEKEKHGE